MFRIGGGCVWQRSAVLDPCLQRRGPRVAIQRHAVIMQSIDGGRVWQRSVVLIRLTIDESHPGTVAPQSQRPEPDVMPRGPGPDPASRCEELQAAVYTEPMPNGTWRPSA